MAVDDPQREALKRIRRAKRDGSTKLSLSGLGLKKLPPEIGDLAGLRTINLLGNQLTSLPPEIGDLVGLLVLDLESNQLTSLPPQIGGLAGLQTLYLNDNQLMSLPDDIRKLTQLELLYLHRNDALGLPPEVLGPTWMEVIRKSNKPARAADILDYYFRTRAETKRRLNEAKLLLVGQGGVGKTSLVRYLVRGRKARPGQPTTEGIDITTWQVTSKIKREKIRLNVWDFGGQEIMHATHQFFLTRRSLYLLVLDARKGENEGNIHYWLRIIQSYAGDSPVIVIANQCDGPNDLDLDERRLVFDYPNIQGFVKTSCTTGLGIRKLKELIGRQINAMPHVFDELPESYFAIQSQLREQARSQNYLDVRDFQKLCRDNSVADEDEQQLLLRFLHDLGTVLNYNDPQDPYRLRDTHILNPKWVTDGVYAIVNHPKLKKDAGVLDCHALGAILKDREAYPADRQAFIVGMMRRFELCFDFPDSNGRRVLIPELLPSNEPADLPWQAPDALRFEYHYKVLPGGLLPRFIVRTNHLLGKPGIHWRSGVVLEVEKCRAYIRGDTQRGRVFITVLDGPRALPGQRRRALSVVRDHFRAIHATIPRIEAAEKVPLSDRPDIVADYETLLKMELAGKTDYWPDGADHNYSAANLLDGVESPEERSARREDRRAAGGDVNIHVIVDKSRRLSAEQIGDSKVNLGDLNASEL